MSEPSFFRPGALFEVDEQAGEHDVPGLGRVPVVFPRDAFAASAGTVIPLRLGEEVIGHARVREARVADDGRSVLMTYEITDLSPGQAGSAEQPGDSS